MGVIPQPHQLIKLWWASGFKFSRSTNPVPLLGPGLVPVRSSKREVGFLHILYHRVINGELPPDDQIISAPQHLWTPSFGPKGANGLGYCATKYKQEHFVRISEGSAWIAAWGPNNDAWSAGLPSPFLRLQHQPQPEPVTCLNPPSPGSGIATINSNIPTHNLAKLPNLHQLLPT